MKISIKTYCTNTLLFILLVWFSHSNAESIQLRVNIEASQLHKDTKALQVKCNIQDDQNVIPIQATIKVNNARVRQSIDIPLTLEKELSHYNTIQCSLHMCTMASSMLKCQQPLSSTNSFPESEAYRVFNAAQPYKLSAQQAIEVASISDSPETVTEAVGSTPKDNSPANDKATSPIETQLSSLAFTPIITSSPQTISMTGKREGEIPPFTPIATISTQIISMTGKRAGETPPFTPITTTSTQTLSMTGKRDNTRSSTDENTSPSITPKSNKPKYEDTPTVTNFSPIQITSTETISMTGKREGQIPLFAPITTISSQTLSMTGKREGEIPAFTPITTTSSQTLSMTGKRQP